jgi:hypothetical protein
MFKKVATVFQEIIRELHGAESEADRIMNITKTVFKLMKQQVLI